MPIHERLLIRKHHLPHWQMGGQVYFLTFRSARGCLPESALDLLRGHILHDHDRRYDLIFGVIMPDHVHLLLRPRRAGANSWYDLAEITRAVKGTSARSINRMLGTEGRLWQAESFDRIIRSETELEQKWQYMCGNPVKAGLVRRPEEYGFFVVAEEPGPEEGMGVVDAT